MCRRSTNSSRMPTLHWTVRRYFNNHWIVAFHNFLIDFHIIFAVRKKLNVKYYFSEEFNCIYLTASDKNDEIDSIYLPITSNASINLIATETIHRTLIQKHAHESIDADRVDFILAIVDPTTTVVYYKLTLSLAMKNHQTNPNSPEQQPSESICQWIIPVEIMWKSV